jgi:2-polyprenyl-3-methyl-5-hydroxy-6-metoxy-1,4-benzoquinol methylase
MFKSDFSRKIISQEAVDLCPLCLSNKQLFLYKDFEGSKFVKCNSCGLVFQNPRYEISYEKEYWGKAIDPDGIERDLVMERETKIKNLYSGDIKYIEKLKGGNILDAGCGFGFFLSALSDKWNKYGLELSEYCIDYIDENYLDIKDIRSEIVENDPFDQEFFDVIYSYHVIEHVKNPVKHIESLYKMLKKGGTLVLSTPNIDSYVSNRFKGNYRLLGLPHIILFTVDTLSMLLKQGGFEIINIKFPFFKTKYFTFNNLLRLYNKKNVSPPFYGNIMTFYTRKV